MNESNIKELRSLIDRFMEAKTTVAEERRLAEYFSSADTVADDLKEFAPMFSWYASIGHRSDVVEDSPSRCEVVVLRQTLLRWVAAAAVITLLFTAGYFLRDYGYERKYEAYKGSYIVRNGEKITNLSVVGPEAERIERDFDERLRHTEEMARRAYEQTRVSMTSGFDMSDPNVRQIVMEYTDI